MTRRETDPAAPVAAPPDVTRLLRQQGSLREIVESIGSELELRPLLRRILEHACGLLDAQRGSIGLRDEERNLVRIEAVFNLPNRELGAELAAGVGLAGRVLETREPVILESYEQLRIMALPELHDRAVMGVPILWGDRLIGTFGVAALPPRRFGDEDLATLDLYARHAAIAIQNERHHGHATERDQRLVRLGRVGRTLASGADLETLCEKAVEAIHEHMGYPNVGLGLIEPGDPRPSSSATSAGGSAAGSAANTASTPAAA
jgi:GAF domain-containing protein